MTVVPSASPFNERVKPWLLAEGLAARGNLAIQEGVCIYGAGELGRLALDYCEGCEIPILAVVDRSQPGFLTSGSGRRYPIIRPDSADAEGLVDRPLAVAIATLPFGALRDELQQGGWKTVVPFYNLTAVSRGGHPLRNGWPLGEVTAEEADIAEWLCRQWADEASWRHYETFVAWHRDNSELTFDDYPIDPTQRYVIPELTSALNRRHRQLVDVGSHRGECVGRLLKAGVQFDEYVLIEPDKESRAYLFSNRDTLLPPDASVSILSDIIGDDRRACRFEEGLGYCSQVWSTSQSERQMIRLDDLELAPDLLKIHTEGTECEILSGARETVARHRPCMAFSVYHRREGFYNDIAEPMRMFRGYRWYFRIHSYQGTGAFVYAVPEAD